MSRVTRNLANPVAPAAQALAGLRRAITDRVKRWRGHPPEKAGVREPRRPKPTLPSAAIALAEPTVRVRRWFRLTGGHNANHT